MLKKNIIDAPINPILYEIIFWISSAKFIKSINLQNEYLLWQFIGSFIIIRVIDYVRLYVSPISSEIELFP